MPADSGWCVLGPHIEPPPLYPEWTRAEWCESGLWAEGGYSAGDCASAQDVWEETEAFVQGPDFDPDRDCMAVSPLEPLRACLEYFCGPTFTG